MERKEAIEVIKKNWPDSSFTILREALETLIPEITESEDSEDERIRQELLALIEWSKSYAASGISIDEAKEMIAWLEKQGEQKPDIDFSDLRTWKYIVDTVWTEKEGIGQYLDSPFTEEVAKKLQKRFGNIEQKPVDKVESKFKVGDFIVNDYCMGRIVEITNDAYLLDTEQGIPFSCEHNTHLWNIQDAKDGDVIYEKRTESIILFKSEDCGWIVSHCSYWQIKKIFERGERQYGRVSEMNIFPATKEQRDLLFKKMHEVGYKWDDEKKELKKIEQKPTEWSEKDEHWRQNAIDFLNYPDLIRATPTLAKDTTDWLKSLKDRAQLQTIWEPSDESMLNAVANSLDRGRVERVWHTTIEEVVDRLKSFKYRCTWKPSKEQMEILQYLCETSSHSNEKVIPILESLYNDLKKL